MKKNGITLEELLDKDTSEYPFYYTAGLGWKELDELEKTIDDPNAKKINIAELYQYFKLDSKQYLEAQKLKKMDILKNYPIDHLVPEKLVEFTSSKINDWRKIILQVCSEEAKKPQVCNPKKSFLKKCKEQLYDAAVYFFSFGAYEVPRMNEEERHNAIMQETFNILTEEMKQDMVPWLLAKYLSIEYIHKSPRRVNFEKVLSYVKELQAQQRHEAAAYRPKTPGNLN